MSLTNPNTPVSQQDLQDFYHKILPYMGGSSGGGGGHTIEDAEGTDLTQRDTMQFGTGFNATDDSENEKTVVNADVMQSGDMDDIVTPLPSIAPKKEGIKYSTTEQVVGEWINGKPLYQKTFYVADMGSENAPIQHNLTNLDNYFIFETYFFYNDDSYYYNDQICSGSFKMDKTYIYKNFKSKEWGNGAKLYITIRYTKTTDTATT